MFFGGPMPILGSKNADIDISADILCVYYSTVPVISLGFWAGLCRKHSFSKCKLNK